MVISTQVTANIESCRSRFGKPFFRILLDRGRNLAVTCPVLILPHSEAERLHMARDLEPLLADLPARLGADHYY